MNPVLRVSALHECDRDILGELEMRPYRVDQFKENSKPEIAHFDIGADCSQSLATAETAILEFIRDHAEDFLLLSAIPALRIEIDCPILFGSSFMSKSIRFGSQTLWMMGQYRIDLALAIYRST